MKKGKRKKLTMIGSAALAVVLAVVLVLSPGAGSIPTVRAEQSENDKLIEDQYKSLMSASDYTDRLGKEETAYVVMDADSNVTDTVVEEWLHNGTDAKTITDESTLSSIKNTSGDEKYVRTGSSLVWKANGNDIKYRGTSKGNLPVSVNVSYYLNGKKLSADEIKGRSGKVQIKFTYTVHEKETIDGYTITHPYTMISGAVLDNDHFSDISVTNGKNVAQDGSSIVVGMALPGLAENLGLTGRIDIPETVTISATAKDFELDGTYTAALSGLLGNIDESGISKAEATADELEASLDELASASSALTDASDALAAGNLALASGTQQLEDSTEELAYGLAQLSSGAAQLNESVLGMSLSLSSDQETELESAAAATVTEELADSSSELSQSLAAISAGVKSGVMEDDDIQSQITTIKNLLVTAGYDDDTAETTATAMVQGIVDGSVDATISAEESNQLFQGIAGSAAAEGAQAALDALPDSAEFQALAEATQSLADGAAEASESVSGDSGETFADGISTLNFGAQIMAYGSSVYAQSMEEFNEEGIQKLVSSLSDEELKEVANRLKAVIDASSEPIFIGGKVSSMSGESRIIFKTDYIGD
jgi:putative membrane protein